MLNLRLIILIFCLLITQNSFAYKVYHYDSEGKRVYKTIEQKDFAKYKNAPRRAFIRQPRTNWEITPQMRARKKPYHYAGKN